MRTISLIYSEQFLKHDTGSNHPESPDRLKSIVQRLKKLEYKNNIRWIKPKKVSKKTLLKIHSEEMINNVELLSKKGGGYLDADTPISSDSFEVALLAAGAWLKGLNEVINGKPAFVLSRPPGHHAEFNKSMGFCLFSNAALTAYKALENDFIKKVAIFDWDVHHGNGTENIIKSNKNILYTSIHQYPLYPGTGFKQEKSTANNILNIPMPAKTDWFEYKNMFYNTLLPKIINFKPDLIIISAGFDAHKADGIANFELSSNNFGEMTSEILKIQCKCLFGLEGGYNLNALAKSVEQVVLMNILFKDY